MRRPATVVIAFRAAILAIAPASADEPTPDAAYTLVARDIWSKDPLPKPEQLAAARKVLAAQAAREPKTARWNYALGRVAAMEADRASGDPEKPLRKEALEQFERAVKLEPGNADYQYWFASASFEHIDDVGMLSKMSLASDGRKAYEKAIAIDPNYVAARIGLARFYLGAPAIAGGSVDKAKQQGAALLAIPDKRGEYQGRMVLAGTAAEGKDWAEMSRQFALAETAGGLGADPVAALRTQVFYLLNQKKDPQAAVPVVERYLKVASSDDLTAVFLNGEVQRQLGHCVEALVSYDQVLAKRAEARGSRWGAAVCHDQLGQKDAARRDYEEYARRFPDDPRAKEAKAAVKKLGGS
jgi:tetratricopeptide (TPR) repeat protein